jgi:hypothetical protein
VQDKIEAYEEELKQTPEFKTLYRYGTNKLHYGYFDKRSKTFKITGVHPELGYTKKGFAKNSEALFISMLEAV